MKSTTTRHYRKNVAIVVVNDTGEVLACHRADLRNVWQIPQGGINEGEAVEAAMFRELEEEIGTRDVEVIGKLPEPIIYDWPEELYKLGLQRDFKGQEQVYFLVLLKDAAKINLANHKPQEFDKVEWVTSEEFLKRISGFKLRPYTEAIQKLRKSFPGVII